MLEVRGIRLSLNGREILKGISLSLPTATLACLVGPNGAGKTLLLETVAGLRRPSSGEVIIGETPLNSLSPRERAKKLAFLPQRSSFFFPFPVEEVVAMGCFAAKRCSPLQAMEKVGILNLRGRPFTEVSEGERKLVLIAKILAQEADLLLLDEPASNLDLKNQYRIYQILKRVSQEGKTVLVSEHNLSLANFCQRVYLIGQGEIKMGGTPQEVLIEENIRKVFSISPDFSDIPLNPQGFPSPSSSPETADKKAGLPFSGPDGFSN